MVEQQAQPVPRRQVAVLGRVQADALERLVGGHEEGVAGAGHAGCQVGHVQEAGDVREALAGLLEGEERVAEELRADPGEGQQRRRLLVAVVLVQPGHHLLRHEHDLADEQDVAALHGRVLAHHLHPVGGQVGFAREHHLPALERVRHHAVLDVGGAQVAL